VSAPARGLPRQNAGLGILLLVVAVSLLSLLDGTAKHLSALGHPVLQVAWARFFFQAVITLPPAALRHGGALWRPRAAVPQAARGLLHAVATLLFFAALARMPLADTLAIYFAYPFVVTALAPLLLGERTGARRWAGVGFGFLGTLLVVRPGLGTVDPGALLALGGSLAFGLYILFTRRFAGSASAGAALAQQSLASAAVLSLFVPFFWTTPEAGGWALFALLGGLSALGHGLIIRAFAHAPASLLAPIGYVEIVAATAVGYAFFGDFPDALTWAGIAVIVASGVYISIRERAARAKAVGSP
jgi:drug/metabolite transporter (DMT)-like permease